ncbi:MAG: hypothetical protein U5L04_09630 [Trueperaceae bacterium]|nr:hypothetical protein [Trueperaceae bacterium]
MKQLLAAIVWSVLVVSGWAAAQDHDRIAYIDPQGRLATTDLSGNARTLTDEGRVFQFPAWAPDGSPHLAAIGAAPGEVGVYVVADEEEAEVRTLFADTPPVYLYWTPDASAVSFIANRPGNTFGLYLAPNEDDTAAELLYEGAPFYWRWDARSERALVHVNLGSADARIGWVSRDNPDTLDENAATPGRFQAPDISVSGDFLAFAEQDALGSSRLVIDSVDDATTTERRELPHDGLVAFAWSPTTDDLALISSPSPSPHYYGPLQLLEADTGNLETLVDDVVLAFFWSPDGRYLAYLTPLSGGGSENVAAARQLQRVSQTLRPAQQAPLLLNLSVYDTDTGDSTLLSTFAPSPLFLVQFLPFFDQYARSHQLWSPRSDAIVLPMLDGQTQSRVTVVSVDGTITPLARGDLPFWSVR